MDKFTRENVPIWDSVAEGNLLRLGNGDGYQLQEAVDEVVCQWLASPLSSADSDAAMGRNSASGRSNCVRVLWYAVGLCQHWRYSIFRQWYAGIFPGFSGNVAKSKLKPQTSSHWWHNDGKNNKDQPAMKWRRHEVNDRRVIEPSLVFWCRRLCLLLHCCYYYDYNCHHKHCFSLYFAIAPASGPTLSACQSDGLTNERREEGNCPICRPFSFPWVSVRSWKPSRPLPGFLSFNSTSSAMLQQELV